MFNCNASTAATTSTSNAASYESTEKDLKGCHKSQFVMGSGGFWRAPRAMPIVMLSTMFLRCGMRCSWPGYRGMATSAAVENAKAALKSAHAVCFDVDSTVCQNEGLCVRLMIQMYHPSLGTCLTE